MNVVVLDEQAYLEYPLLVLASAYSACKERKNA